MKRLDDPEVAAWLKKAGRDLVMAKRALDGPEPFYDHACFHAQQAAEKALKCLIVSHSLQVKRTHDLVALIRSAPPLMRLFVGEQEAAAELSKHAITPRYPSFLSDETLEDAQQALLIATHFLNTVQNELG